MMNNLLRGSSKHNGKVGCRKGTYYGKRDKIFISYERPVCSSNHFEVAKIALKDYFTKNSQTSGITIVMWAAGDDDI